MEKLKIDTIVLEGIDRCGKDMLLAHLSRMDRKYILTARGIISNLSYCKIFEREPVNYDLEQHKHELYVFIDVDKDDWAIRCSLTDEPTISYDEHTKAFDKTAHEVKDAGINVLFLNSSEQTIHQMAEEILVAADSLNKIKPERE